MYTDTIQEIYRLDRRIEVVAVDPMSNDEGCGYMTARADIYPAPGLCEGLPHVPWQGDRWELRATADCDAPNVFGPRDEDGAMAIAVTLDLPALPPEELFASTSSRRRSTAC